MMRRAWVALALLTACTQAPAARGPAPVTLGAVYPLTGVQAPYGAEEFRGVETAVRMFNARGGLGGRPVRLDVADAPSVDAAWNGAWRLARAGVPAILGSYGSTIALAGSEVAHRNRLVWWETGAVADLVTSRRYPEVFRTGPSGATLAAQAAEFAVRVIAPRYRIPVRRLAIAVVYEDDPYGASVGAGITRQAQSLGFRLAGSFPYDPSTEDFAGIVASLRRLRPDVVVAATYLDDGARFRTRMLEEGPRLRALIGKCAAFYTNEMARLLGPSINGVFVADKPMGVARAALRPEARALEDEMRLQFLERYGHDPDAAAYMGFSGAWAFLAHVLPRARSLSADDLRRAALSLDLPTGSLPNGSGVRFAPPGDPMAGQNLNALGVVWQWQHERAVLVYPDSVARGAPVFAPR